ncbi:hypothetical protein HMPREF1143_0200 [Peptoanaerobacter stomatis]|uniref:Uncharacterized protein n=1 Tax=Peptoanaerobacter stomatis TaxID=796937 RepID=J5WET6_9FIRM|nr:hypothetical protein [Peptoanaerobacter stomatis]EJU21442.1 hypothetical protein HMPREF1143_0200 [Peptoanaerobacter stomatis]
MKSTEAYEELQRLTKKLKLSSISELEELGEDIYDEPIIFFENIDNIEVYEDTSDLDEYGRRLIDRLNIDIADEIKKYVNYEAYAEDYLEKTKKCYVCKYGNLYIYPAEE